MPRVLPTDGLIPCFSAAERRGVPAHGLVVPTSFTTKQVDAEQFEFSVAGAGSGNLSGQTKQLSIQVSGAGKVLAPALVADAATIEISGAGSADVHAVTTLKVSVSGAGTVTYSGNPQISKMISGAGGVRPVQRENPLAEKQEGQGLGMAYQSP